MLHLEDSAAVPSGPTTNTNGYDNHDLFYHHYDHDPLLYFAEYNKNNPIDMDNDDDDVIMESTEEVQQATQVQQRGSFHKKEDNTSTVMHSTLEPISEDEEEGEEQYNHFR